MSRLFSALAPRSLPIRVLVGVFAGLALIVETPRASAQTSLPIVQPRSGSLSLANRERVSMFVPAEKRYDELMPDQKAKFRAQFSNLADADEPSYPIAGLRPVAEEIVHELAGGSVGKGALFMTVHVDEQGEAKSTAVFDMPDARVSRVVAVVLMKTKYKPAICKGKPCSSEFPFTARFDVE
jgi:hypothetical protein